MDLRMPNDKIFDILLKMAETVEPVASARLTAAIVIRNRIISFGTNKRKSHPFQKKYGKNVDAIYLHAEIDAIKNALRTINSDELSKATLYVARAKKGPKRNFVTGLARPCQNGCCNAIAAFNIKYVFYTTNEQGVYQCL